MESKTCKLNKLFKIDSWEIHIGQCIFQFQMPPKPPPYFQSNESSIIFLPPQPPMHVRPFNHSTTTAPIIDPNVNAPAYQPSAPPLTISPSACLMLYAHLVLRTLDLNEETGADVPFGFRRLIDYNLLSIHELSSASLNSLPSAPRRKRPQSPHKRRINWHRWRISICSLSHDMPRNRRVFNSKLTEDLVNQGHRNMFWKQVFRKKLFQKQLFL